MIKKQLRENSISSELYPSSDKIKKQMNYEGEIIWDEKMPVGPNRRKISVQLARKKINFDPKFSLQEGIKNTIDFYINSKK